MANIPTIPGSSQIQDVQIGVKRNAGVELQRYGAARQAFKAAAGGVEEAMGALTEYEDRKRKAEEVAAFNEASVLTRQTTSAFRDSLRKNPNDTQWVQSWQQTSQATREQIMADPRLVGASRTKMSQVLNSWQGDTTAEFQTAADIAGSERRKRTGLLAVDAALRDGNREAAVKSIDGMVQTGDMWREDGDKLKNTLNRTLDDYQAQNRISADPATAEDFLLEKDKSGKFVNLPALTPDRRMTLARSARTFNNAAQSAAMEGLRERIDKGDQLTPEFFEEQVKAKHITQRGADSLMDLIQHHNTSAAKADAGELAGEVSVYDPVQDKDGTRLKELKERMVGLPSTYYRDLQTELNKRVKAGKGAGDNGLQVINRMFQMGALGEWETVDPKTGKRTRDKPAFVRANEARWDLQDDLTKWREKNPNASLHDEREYAKTITYQLAVERTKKAISTPQQVEDAVKEALTSQK